MRLPTKKDLYNSNVGQWVLGVCASSWFAKIIVSLIIWSIALVPTYLYLLVRWGIGPEGFWQELALIITCAIVIGWLQAILLFLAIMTTIVVLVDEL
jgi:hypothetical protein